LMSQIGLHGLLTLSTHSTSFLRTRFLQMARSTWYSHLIFRSIALIGFKESALAPISQAIVSMGTHSRLRTLGLHSTLRIQCLL